MEAQVTPLPFQSLFRCFPELYLEPSPPKTLPDPQPFQQPAFFHKPSFPEPCSPNLIQNLLRNLSQNIEPPQTFHFRTCANSKAIFWLRPIANIAGCGTIWQVQAVLPIAALSWYIGLLSRKRAAAAGPAIIGLLETECDTLLNLSELIVSETLVQRWPALPEKHYS